jgi:hypothetical protein
VPQIRGKTGTKVPVDILVDATGRLIIAAQITSSISIPVTIAAMPSTPVTGTFWPAIQPCTLGNSAGKTNVLKTGNLVTTAVTADQVILTYTVTAGKTFYLQYLLMMARLTTFAATATLFGAASLENPSGTKVATLDIAGPQGITAPPIVLEFAEPIPIAAASVIRIVCTPSAVTSFTWKACFGGFEV